MNYYVVASVGHRQMVWGGYRSRAEADRIGMTRANGNYQIVQLDTSSLEAATQMIRESGIEENGLNPYSFKNFRHS